MKRKTKVAVRRVSLALDDGRAREVPCTPVGPYLAVHRRLLLGAEIPRVFTITHVPTGYAFSNRTYTRKRALVVARRLDRQKRARLKVMRVDGAKAGRFSDVRDALHAIEATK